MYPISDTLKQLFLNGNKKCCKLTLNNATTVDCVITEADILSDSLTVDRYCSSGNKIEVGSAIAAELTLTLLNNDKKFNDITFEGSEVSLEIGIEGVSDSYIPCGKFTIDEPPRSSLHIKLRALDFMMLFDKKVDANDIQEIDTVEGLLVKCCEICNVEIWDKKALKNLPNIDQTVKVPTTADITYRQIIQWIAQLTGTCAFMDWEGKLRLSWFKDSGVVLDPTNRYIGGTLDENNITIKGVCIKTQNTVVTTEDSVNPVVIESNQLLYSDDESYLEAIADNIAKAIGTLTYRPFQCNTIPMPFLYPLDIVGYEGAAEGDFPTVITNHNFGLNKASALSAVGETATQSGYSSVKGLTKAEIDSAIREAMNGIDAKAEHIHIRYSAYENGFDASGNASMSDKPDATTEYLGTCATNSTSPPDTPSSYKWAKIRGADGTNGKDGQDGKDGEDGKDGGTLQVKYKNSATVPTITSNDVSDWDDAVPTPSAGQRVYMTQKLSTETNWSTPIQISAEDGTTPEITISDDGYWMIDGEKSVVKAQGEDGNTPTITVGANGNWFVDGKDTNTKAQGAQGKDGADIEYVYYLSSDGNTPSKPSYSGTTLSDGWTASPQGITSTYKYEYVSVRTKAAGSSTWGAFSPPVIWSKWGEKGTDGDGVEYKYFIADIPGEYSYEAGDQTWTDEPTGVDEDWKYEYVVQIKHNGDGSTVISNPGTLWAKWGETGKKGDSATAYMLISSSSVIAKSASGTLSPSTITLKGQSKTGTADPVNFAGYFTVETSTSSNLSSWSESGTSSGSSSYNYSIGSTSIKGLRCSMYLDSTKATLLDQQIIPVVSDGTNGGDAYTVILSNESHTFAGDTSKALSGQNIFVRVVAYKGATRVKGSIGTIANVPTGMSVVQYADDGNGEQFEVWISGTMTTTSGTLTIPVTVDGKTFNKQFSYSLALKGTTGDEGNGITSVAVTYATSTDGTTVPTSGWQSSVPSLSEGDYLWTKTVTNYKKTDPTTSYTVSRVGANGEKGKGVSSIVDYYTATTTSEDKLINGNGTVLVEEVSRTAGTNGVHHGLDDYYIIDMNQVNNSYCLIKLTLKLTATANVVLNCISCGEHGTSTVYDYMMVSNISSSDSTYKLAESNSADSGEKLKKKFNVVSEQSTTPIQVSFGNYSAGTYYIYIKARKDSSNTENEYFAFQCGTLFSGNNWTTYIPSDFNEKNPYLWKYTRINYDDGTHTETSKQIISHWGKTGKDGQNLYAESTTSANTQTKAATLKTGNLASLTTGITVTVKFTNANTFSMPNLNVNSTGNYQIKWNKVTPTGDNPFYWPAGAVMTFVFDGSSDTKYWVIADVGSTKMDMQSAGLVVGNYSSSGTLQNNVLIGASDVQIRNNETVYAKFGTEVIIGRTDSTYNNILIDSDSIDIRRGTTTLAGMTYRSDTTYGDTFTIKGPNMLDITSANVVRLVTDYSNNSDSANAYLTVHSNGGHGVFSALTTKVKDSKTYQSSLGLTSESAELFAYSYIDNAAKESKVEVKPEAITLDSPNTYLKGSLVLPNNASLFAYKGDNKTAKSILRVSSGNWVDLGVGLYSDNVGGTTIYGRKIMFYAKPGGTSVNYKPYYSKKASSDTTDDSTTIVLHTTGYLKDVKSTLYYTIPLAKPVIGSPTVSVATTQGYILYQNGNYINGSGMSTRAKTSSCNAYLGGNQDLLYVVANFSDTTNAIANAPVGINVTVTITFT